MALKIITDSASDLPKAVTEALEIEVIATPVLINGSDYFDGKTIQAKKIYEILRDGKEMVSTYHINTYMFIKHFEPYAKRGDQLIYICFSTGIAGTYNAANQAKEDLMEIYPDFDLTIIDSKCASLGFGLVVMYAGWMLRAGAQKEEIIEAIKYHCEHMRHVFTVDTLEYLLKSGRIGKTSAIAGEILNIRPIITVDDNGSLKAEEKVRGRTKSIRRLIDYVGEHGVELSKQTVGIVHGDDEETVNKIKEMLREKYGATLTIDNYVGCAIGAHTGPGIVGIVFLDAHSPYITKET